MAVSAALFYKVITRKAYAFPIKLRNLGVSFGFMGYVFVP